MKGIVYHCYLVISIDADLRAASVWLKGPNKPWRSSRNVGLYDTIAYETTGDSFAEALASMRSTLKLRDPGMHDPFAALRPLFADRLVRGLEDAE